MRSGQDRVVLTIYAGGRVYGPFFSRGVQPTLKVKGGNFGLTPL